MWENLYIHYLNLYFLSLYIYYPQWVLIIWSDIYKLIPIRDFYFSLNYSWFFLNLYFVQPIDEIHLAKWHIVLYKFYTGRVSTGNNLKRQSLFLFFVIVFLHVFPLCRVKPCTVNKIKNSLRFRMGLKGVVKAYIKFENNDFKVF